MPDMPEDTFRWVIAGAVAISTLCILIMAVTAVVIYRVLARMKVRTETIADLIEPIADSVQHLIRQNGPKVSAFASRAVQIADNTKDMTDVAREQAHRFAEVGRDFAAVGQDAAVRVRAQLAKVDAAVEGTVDQVQVAGANLKDAALKPVREASGFVAGVKAAVSTYTHGRRTGVGRIAQDEEMFI